MRIGVHTGVHCCVHAVRPAAFALGTSDKQVLARYGERTWIPFRWDEADRCFNPSIADICEAPLVSNTATALSDELPA
jgi:hypothetical protein